MAAARVEVVEALGRVLGGRVEDLRRLSGGASRVTSSFDLIDNAGVRRQLVIQQDRGDGATQIGAVSAEAALLRAAHRGGVPVAEVVASGEGEGLGPCLLYTSPSPRD